MTCYFNAFYVKYNTIGKNGSYDLKRNKGEKSLSLNQLVLVYSK